MLLWLYTHVLSVCFKCFICFQMYVSSVYLDVSKVDLGEHMLQWSRWLANNSLPQPPAASAGAPPAACGGVKMEQASCMRMWRRRHGTMPGWSRLRWSPRTPGHGQVNQAGACDRGVRGSSARTRRLSERLGVGPFEILTVTTLSHLCNYAICFLSCACASCSC
jgi:hypothetical protein